KTVTNPKTDDKILFVYKREYDTTYYQFKWYRMDDDDEYDSYYRAVESISVEYYDGFISSYSHSYKNRSSKPSFAKLSANEQEDLAKKYLYQLNPDLKGNPVIERTSDELNLFDNTVNYRISRKENGIDFGSNRGSITIDRDTGELLTYSLTWWSDAKLPDASKKLSVKEVSDIYASRKPLKAYYDIFTKYEYNAETDERTYTPYVLAVYEPSVSGENKIDALTGKYTSLYDDMEKFSYTDAYTWRESEGVSADAAAEDEDFDDDDYDLSDAEKEALEKEDEYLSYEEALKIIKADEYIVFNKELVLKNNIISSYKDDYGVSRPSRYLQFEFTSSDDAKDNIYLNVTLDAYSGKIISFSKTYDYGDKSANKNTTVLNEKTALAVAGKAAKHFIGDKAGEYRYNNNVKPSKYTTEATFGYTRYVNELPTAFDYINVKVDSRGEVLGFNYKYREIEFPEANLVTEEEAYKKLFEHMKPSLYYTGFTDLQLASHVYLTYEFEPNYLINAITGERIAYNGEPYYISEKESEPQKEAKLYTDIKGHKYEKEITTLFEYGIRITDSETLDPDGAITIEEFAKLCKQAHGTNILGLYPNERKFNEETGRYEYFENPMLKKKLTRGELAKIYVYTYANDCFTAAAIEGIYAPPYKNVPQDNPYCGYIAIAKAKGLIADGEEFGYNKTLTRGKCLKAFYDYIANDKEKELYEIAAI
ncbi:MAG: hypothetical protein K2G87_07155, partial [Oscillospiraceae bacterium]|nr:hypothetical protein [Oscillospiraceae bacterium]